MPRACRGECRPSGEVAIRLVLVVDTGRSEPATLVPEVIREINRMDPDLPVGRALTGPQFLRQPIQDVGGPGASVWGPALLALVLAMVGLYGFVAYSLSRRTSEFGVRIALGARPSEVATLVLRQGAALKSVCAGIGLIVSLGVARVLAELFYQVRPFSSPWSSRCCCHS